MITKRQCIEFSAEQYNRLFTTHYCSKRHEISPINLGKAEKLQAVCIHYTKNLTECTNIILL